jgi:hypothetical protein
MRRNSKRILTNLKAIFSCDHFLYIGTVTNCSKTGMCINTKHCISANRNIDITIPLEDELLNLSGRMKRIDKEHNVFHTIGVELLNPTQKYLDYLGSLMY